MRVFVDTSVILAFLAGQDDRAKDLIRRIEEHEVTGYINPLVIDEVIYGYLRLATGVSARRIRKLLARREERLIKNDQERSPAYAKDLHYTTTHSRAGRNSRDHRRIRPNASRRTNCINMQTT